MGHGYTLLHLSCVVNASASPAARNTQLMHMRDRVRVWFEHVECKANWSDSTCRDARMDLLFVCRMFFHIGKFYGPTWPWSQQDCSALEFRSLCRLEQRWNDPRSKCKMHRRRTPTAGTTVERSPKTGGPSSASSTAGVPDSEVGKINRYVPFTVQGRMGHAWF